MKNLIFASTLLLISFTSCTKAIDCCVTGGALQKWELVEMSNTMFTPTVTTGSDMDWQEHYLFNHNTGTFNKSRTKDELQTFVSGTFKIVTTEAAVDEHFFELTYSSDNEIIANCTGDLIEVLIIDSENTLKGTWDHCDGPGLKYKRVQ
ncbi:hypothetical protein ACV07N_05260 [Roseivirga echinicomitans]